MQAGHALGFSLETIARVTTRIHFLAHGIAKLDASLISADMLESRKGIEREINHHL